MTTSIIVTESVELTKTKNPSLPLAPVTYDRAYVDSLNNILRQYFNTLDNFVGQMSLAASSYGSFADTTTQTATANTATVMTFDTTDFASGVTLESGSRLKVSNAGVYNFQWSGQFQNTDTQEHDVSVWVRKNGTDVVGSTGLIGVPSKHGGVNGHGVFGWNFLFTLAANDYIELWWSTPNVAVTIHAYPVGTSPTRPSTSSLVATMTFTSAL